MKRFIAIRPIRYGGKSYKPGQEFDVMNRHAGIIRVIGKAEDAPPKVDRGVWGGVLQTAKAPDEPVAEVSAETVKPKRKYTRRVKVAEGDAAGHSRFYKRRDMTAGDH
jgi:hypothetical protein